MPPDDPAHRESRLKGSLGGHPTGPTPPPPDAFGAGSPTGAGRTPLPPRAAGPFKSGPPSPSVDPGRLAAAPSGGATPEPRKPRRRKWAFAAVAALLLAAAGDGAWWQFGRNTSSPAANVGETPQVSVNSTAATNPDPQPEVTPPPSTTPSTETTPQTDPDDDATEGNATDGRSGGASNSALENALENAGLTHSKAKCVARYMSAHADAFSGDSGMTMDDARVRYGLINTCSLTMNDVNDMSNLAAQTSN